MTTLQTPAPIRRRAGAPGRPDRWLAAGLLALAVGLAVNTVLGPLLTGVVAYPFSDSVLSEALGLEAVTLVLVVPLMTLAAVLSAAGQRAGPVLALATSGYAAYMLVQYVVGPQYPTHRLPVLAHLVLLVLSLSLLARAWTSARRTALAERSRGWAVVVAGLAAFVVVRWLPAIVGAWDATAVPAAATDLTMYWSIFLLDLGVVVPAAAATAVGLVRRAAWSTAALYGLVGWFALVPPSVAAMSLVKLARDDPAATVADTTVLLAAAVVGAALAALLFSPLLRRRRSALR